VDLSYENSQSAPVQQARTNWAGALRHELSHRAEQYAVKHELPHCLSYGRSPTVCFECYGDSRHGIFCLPRIRPSLEIRTGAAVCGKSTLTDASPCLASTMRFGKNSTHAPVPTLCWWTFSALPASSGMDKSLQSSASSPMPSPISASWHAYHCKTGDSTGQKWICD